MAQRAIEILKDDSTLAQFKKRAADHAKKFDIHAIVPLYEKLYERFI